MYRKHSYPRLSLAIAIILLLATAAGCVGTPKGSGQAEDAAPEAGPPQNQLPPPWKLVAQGRHYGSAGLDKSQGELKLNRARIQGSRSFFMPGGYMFTTGLAHEISSYDFAGSGRPGVTGSIDDVSQTTLHTRLASSPADWGFWLATLNVTAGRAEDADWDDSCSLSGGVGWMYPVRENLKVGLAVIGWTALEGDGQVLPVPLIEWQINDYLRIGSIESGEPGAAFIVKPVENHEFYSSFEFARRQFRIDDSVVSDGAFVDDEAGIRVGWLWNLGNGLKTDVFVGGTEHRFKLDAGDRRLMDNRADPTFYGGVSASFMF